VVDFRSEKLAGELLDPRRGFEPAAVELEIRWDPLTRQSARILPDAGLATQIVFARAATKADPESRWVSTNANHMLPAGSSVFHPHLQGSVNPFPTTFQKLLADVAGAQFRSYLESEKRDGTRYLGSTGHVDWLASFAPLGPAELRAFVPGVASPTELDGELTEELGGGIATALGLYADLGFESFNMALYGAPVGTPDYPLNLRMMCRSNPEPLYRSDATWLERLHWEAAVDISPERLAEEAAGRFGR